MFFCILECDLIINKHINIINVIVDVCLLSCTVRESIVAQMDAINDDMMSLKMRQKKLHDCLKLLLVSTIRCSNQPASFFLLKVHQTTLVLLCNISVVLVYLLLLQCPGHCTVVMKIDMNHMIC